MAKICWLDLETSGINPKENGILEIGAIMEIDGKEVSTFQTYIRPDSRCVIDPGALEVNGLTLDEIQSYPSESEAKRLFTDWLGQFIDKFNKNDKALIGGFNVHFDIDFLMAFWNRAGDKYLGSWFYWHAVDLRSFSAFYLRNHWNQMPNGKLQTVVKAILGEEAYEELMEGKVAHSALTDIRGTREAFYTLINRKPE